LRFDIEKTKEMGFNMIRKHVKVEPARWYTHCDRLGILVWQDMPSGDMGNQWESRPGITGRETERDRSSESETYFREEWAAIMQDFHNFPSKFGFLLMKPGVSLKPKKLQNGPWKWTLPGL
jgi:beta-galactosidase/beta-glucuronidase